MTKKKALKLIHVRIIPLAELKKPLTAARLATTDFEDAQKLKWSIENKDKHAELLTAESNARRRVANFQRSPQKG